MVHTLKIFPWHFYALVTNKCRFEVRVNDRDYKIGDVLKLEEYVPSQKRFTGHFIDMEITYILPLSEIVQVQTDYVVLQLKKIC